MYIYTFSRLWVSPSAIPRGGGGGLLDIIPSPQAKTGSPAFGGGHNLSKSIGDPPPPPPPPPGLEESWLCYWLVPYYKGRAKSDICILSLEMKGLYMYDFCNTDLQLDEPVMWDCCSRHTSKPSHDYSRIGSWCGSHHLAKKERSLWFPRFHLIRSLLLIIINFFFNACVSDVHLCDVVCMCMCVCVSFFGYG